MSLFSKTAAQLFKQAGTIGLEAWKDSQEHGTDFREEFIKKASVRLRSTRETVSEMGDYLKRHPQTIVVLALSSVITLGALIALRTKRAQPAT